VSGGRRVWSARLTEFAFWATNAFLVPYLAVFYRQAGLSGFQIGLQAALVAAFSMLTGPVWGTLADRSRKPRLVFQICIAGSAAAALLLGQQSGFLPITLATAAYSLFAGGSWTLMDVMVVHQIRDTGVGYGSVRLWGSLGWTAVVWAAGEWIVRTSVWNVFVGFAVGAVITLFVAALLSNPSLDSPAGSGLGFVRTVFRSPPLLWLAAGLLLGAMSEVGPFRFLPIYAVDLGGNEGLAGLAMAIGAFLEWPFMLAADRLIARFPARRVLGFGALLWVAAWTLAAVVPSAPWIILVIVLNSAAYTLHAVGLINAVTRRAPPERSGEALGFFSVTLRSFAELIGGPLSGWGYDVATGRGMNAISAGIAFVAWGLFLRMNAVERKAATSPPSGAAPTPTERPMNTG
jgi:PPP family 3-phenylpropionic acid transporter